jgi:hypothetical protein
MADELVAPLHDFDQGFPARDLLLSVSNLEDELIRIVKHPYGLREYLSSKLLTYELMKLNRQTQPDAAPSIDDDWLIRQDSHRFGVILPSLVGREWIQADGEQETRLPTDGKKSRIESVPNAGIA